MWRLGLSIGGVLGLLLFAGGAGAFPTHKHYEGCTQFHYAAARADLAAVRKMLDAGKVDLAARCGLGNTALHLVACGHRSVRRNAWDQAAADPVGVTRLLIARGAPLEAGDHNLRGALHAAAACNQPGMIRALVEGGADMNATGKWGHTPLVEAAYRDSAEALAMLLWLGADPGIGGRVFGYTPLHAAAWKNNLRALDVLLQAGLPLEVRGKRGDMPLHDAAQHGALGAIERLLAAGADPNARNESGRTPLMVALAEMAKRPACKAAARRLVAGGTDLSASDVSGGYTHLSLAVLNGYEEGASLLVELGAKLDAPGDRDGQTPLHQAADAGRLALLGLLLDRGVDPNPRDHYQQTPLHLAANEGESEAALLLIRRGADLGAVNKWGQTPLHLAARSNLKKVVRALIARRVDLDAGDEDGETPMDSASEKGHMDIVDMLRKAGAKDDP